MDNFSFLGNGDIGNFDHLFEQFCQNPESVDESWRRFFEGFEFSKANYNQGVIDASIPEAFQKEVNVLNLIGFDWLKFQQLILSWVDLNFEHQYFDEVKDFAESGFNRLEHDLKDIRNILIGLMTNKPWEVVVGQAIAQLSIQGGSNDEGSLRFFLGDKVCRTLLKLDPA